ncbi:MAG: hypothetical protein ACK53E_08870, partial [Pseudanabaena sp.]
LQSSFAFQQEQSEKFAAERDAAWRRFNAASVAFQRALLAKLRDLASRQVPVMIELRRDLGLAPELHGLDEQMREQMQRMEGHFNALIAKLGDG